MAKNILLTTLSTKPKGLPLNYYYTQSKDGLRFCSGISQLEAGSKYILSTVPIEKIVIVGSKETVSPEKTTDVEKRSEYLSANDSNTAKKSKTDSISNYDLYEKMSAYDLYKKRMTAFLAQTNTLDEEAAQGMLSKNGSIDQNRIIELKELTKRTLQVYFSEQTPPHPLSQKETMTEADLQETIQNMLQTEATPIASFAQIIKKLNIVVTENIKSSFEKSYDTTEYDTLMKKHGWHTTLLETEKKEMLHSYQAFKREYFLFISKRNADADSHTHSFFKEQKEKIEQDTTLSSLGRQYMYIQLKDHMDAVQKELLQKNILDIENEIYQLRLDSLQLKEDKEQLKKENLDAKQEILLLKAENERLQAELQLIKSNRIMYETVYVKYYLFSLIQEKTKLQALPENKNIPLQFIPEVEEYPVFASDSANNTQSETQPKEIIYTQDNLFGLANALYTTNKQKTNEEIYLYIDMQGGSRTSGYVRNAVLSILTNQQTNPVAIKQIIAINFSNDRNFSEIADETARYKIIDLASGMNAFIRYGKADIMETYCNSIHVPNDSRLRELVNNMVHIDHALSLCDMNGLTDSIEQLRDFFKDENKATKKILDSSAASYDAFDNIYQVLKDGIYMDYHKLLENNSNNTSNQNPFQAAFAKPSLNMIELIDWACRKGFIQQALTLIESKMPEEYFERKWLVKDYQNTHPNRQDYWDKFMNNLGQSYETENNRIFYLLAKHKKPHSMANVRLIRSKNSNTIDFETQKRTCEEATAKEKAKQFAEFWIQYQTQRDGGTGTHITNTSTHPLLRNISNERNDREFNLIITNILNHDSNNQYRNMFGLNQTDFNEYLKQQLHTTKETLNALREKLITSTPQETITLQERFLFLYCKFCTLEKYLDKKGNPTASTQNSSTQNYMEERMKKNEFTFDLFYHVITIEPEDTLSNKPLSCSSTLLSCLNRNDYLIYTKDYANELKAFCITLHNKLNTNVAKRKLEELFLLHQALKIERNCNNHASQKGIRLPKPVVEYAIKLYVEKFKEIQAIVDRRR